jgi:phosphate transport system substrate-binding protein
MRRLTRLVAIVAAALTLACGDARDARELPDTPEPPNKAELAQLRGDVIADGSSTVYPITQAAAEEFMRFARHVRIAVGVSGTGGGFKRFCNGETDISGASRPIKPSEREACAAHGIEFIEVPVAFDAIAVAVSPENTWADCLTTAELRKLWEPEAQGKVTNWSQVRASFPNRSLRLFGPGTDSGTFDYFTEAIVGTEKASRGDYQASEDDNLLVTGIARDPSALGYFGYAYAVENADKVKVLAVDNGDGHCVRPSAETVRDTSYQPLSRPLFIYVAQAAAEHPEVAAFVNFMLSPSFTPLIVLPEVGYVPLPDSVYAAVTNRFNAMTTGTLFPNGTQVGASLDRYLQ